MAQKSLGTLSFREFAIIVAPTNGVGVLQGKSMDAESSEQVFMSTELNSSLTKLMLLGTNSIFKISSDKAGGLLKALFEFKNRAH